MASQLASKSPDACHLASTAAAESILPSAPTALGWVCLEQPGAWGSKAFTTSGLNPNIGAEIEQRATQAKVRAELIRRPGHHVDHGATERFVLVASTLPGDSWLLGGTITSPHRLLDLDFPAIAHGERPDWAELSPIPEPVLLVCTHGRRDVCCASLGREVAATAATDFPGRVWEASHLSGHRFAATTALLPSGHLHGRVLDARPILAAADRGTLHKVGWRGRSTWTRAGQAAEGEVRIREDRWDLDAYSIEPDALREGVGDRADDSAWRVLSENDSWALRVTEYHSGVAPTSCGKPPEPLTRFAVDVR